MSAQLDLLANDSDGASLTPIRVETALSRFPVHRLAKKGTIAINLQAVKWEVTYNSKYGQPGPLAYKLDTLVVNRKIDDGDRPVQKLLKLGSLHEIAQHLGLGGDTSLVKKALHQNASAYIEFSIRYKRKDGTEKTLEQGDNRYGVVFTGEKLPNGSVADAVYLVLHDWYRDLLNDVSFRPLDYEYLKELTPGAQRFYELLSFQVFGALASKRARAKLLYSDYCCHAPQVRYCEWEAVRKQMYKVHLPHIESGYITKVDYQKTLTDGKPDWEMLYSPGPKAEREYRAVSKRRQTTKWSVSYALSPAIPASTAGDERTKEINDKLLAELTRRGITESKARTLLANLKPNQPILEQLAHADALIAQAPRGKIRNPAGFYVRFIEENNLVPQPFKSSLHGTTSTEVLEEQGRDRYQAILNDPSASEAEKRIARAVLARS